MAITVVPGYRVVAKYAKQAASLPPMEAVEALEGSVRQYVRSLFSVLHPSLIDMGERSAIAQLGDPNIPLLLDSLAEIERGAPKSVAESAISQAFERLARPDLSSRIILMPGDGESGVLTRQMNGVLGFSMGYQAMVVFLWPVPGWDKWLRYTVTHEYVHLVRNLLFPRGLAGGKLMFIKSQEPETLLDAMVVEGIADVFAMQAMPDVRPRWTDALTPEQGDHMWPRIQRRLSISDSTEIRRMLFGDNDRVPPWTGYTFGNRIVLSYLERHPDTKVEALIGMTAAAVYEGANA